MIKHCRFIKMVLEIVAKRLFFSDLLVFVSEELLFMNRDLRRVAEVWLDGYKRYFYVNRPAARMTSHGRYTGSCIT